MKLYQPYISTLMIVLLTAAITFVYPTTVHGQCEVAQLVGSGGLGKVSLNGDIAVVGDSQAFGSLGAAYVFRSGPGGPQDWTLEAVLMAPEPDTEDVFGRAVGVSGNAIIVSAPGANAPEFQSGAAYIYRYDPTAMQYDPKAMQWTFEATLTASDGALGDKFGWSVAVDGDVVLIGARDDEPDGGFNGGFNAGAAYIFRYNSRLKDWIEEAKLTDPNADEGDLLGFSVSISGDVALVGAPGNDDAGGGTGAAFVFRRDPAGSGDWLLQEQLTAFDALWQAWFGFSVSLADDIALIGAPQLDSQIGAAYVLRYDGKSWVHEAKLLASNPVGPFPLLGTSVSISADGSTALVGAPLDDQAGNEAGAAHLFRSNGKKWNEIIKVTASDGGPGQDFGGSVALNGDIALIKGGQNGSTKAYIFAGIQGADCNKNDQPDTCDIFEGSSDDEDGNGIPDECESIPGDIDADGVVGVLDLLILLGAWGACPDCDNCPADLNGDCLVGVLDLLILLSNWG